MCNFYCQTETIFLLQAKKMPGLALSTNRKQPILTVTFTEMFWPHSLKKYLNLKKETDVPDRLINNTRQQKFGQFVFIMILQCFLYILGH